MNEALIPRCTKLLLPIVRFCLRRGLKMQEMNEALKHALVIAAHDELERLHTSSNISKVAAITGIHRRDVMRLGDKPTPKVGSMNILAKVLGQWEHDKRFSTKGTMNPLSLSTGRHSFHHLVESVSQDLNAGTILAELRRLNFVREEEGRIIPNTSSFSDSQATLEDGVRMLSYNLHGLCESVDENLTSGQKTPHLQVATTYDNLCVEKLDEMKRWILREGTAFHKRLREYLASFDKDINPTLARSRGGGKITVGSFSFTEEPRGGKIEMTKEES